jgi:4-amino-4-deoxy-L-arabinose transferase-like glycosyltransferase
MPESLELNDRNLIGEDAAVSGSLYLRRLGAWRRSDWIAVGLLIAVGTGLPLVAAIGTEALGIPHDDDWAYTRIAETLYHTHHLTSLGWGVMTLYGQIITDVPLLHLTANANWSFGLYGAIFGAICLASSYCLARRFLPTSRALLAVCCVALAPGFLAMETTFMTDVPALAMTTICLATGIAALDRAGRSRWVWLVLSMAAGIVGFSIRQFVVIAPIAVLASALARSPRDWKPLLALGIATIAACLEILAWFHGIPGPHQSNDWVPTWGAELSVVKLLGASVALAVLPASVLVIIVGNARSSVRIAAPIALVAIVALLVGLHADPGSPLIGDIFTKWGSPGALIAIGTRPELFPGADWTTIEWASWAALACAVAALLAHRHHQRQTLTLSRIRSWMGQPQGLLAIFVLGSGGFLALVAGSGVWDRYCWPIVGPLAVLILLRERPSPRGPMVNRVGLPLFALLIASLAFLQLAVSFNADAFDAARWRAGVTLTRLDIAPRNIDAGFEWLGYYQPVPVKGGIPAGYPVYRWYEEMYSLPPLCGIVSSSPANFAGFSPAGSTTYKLLAVGGPLEHLYLYKARDMHTCATVPG